MHSIVLLKVKFRLINSCYRKPKELHTVQRTSTRCLYFCFHIYIPRMSSPRFFSAVPPSIGPIDEDWYRGILLMMKLGDCNDSIKREDCLIDVKLHNQHSSMEIRLWSYWHGRYIIACKHDTRVCAHAEILMSKARRLRLKSTCAPRKNCSDNHHQSALQCARDYS